MSDLNFNVGRAHVRIEQDEDGCNPRTEWDNAGTMVCFHSRYHLGDMENKKPIFDTPEEFRQWWKDNGDGGILIPVFLYDHSGLRISTGPFSCPWDSGQNRGKLGRRRTICKWRSRKARRRHDKINIQNL